MSLSPLCCRSQGTLGLRQLTSSLPVGFRLCPTYGCPSDLDDKQMNSHQNKDQECPSREAPSVPSTGCFPLHKSGVEGQVRCKADTCSSSSRMRKIKAVSVTACGGGGREVLPLPHGPQSEPSRLLGFLSALCVPLLHV